MDLHEDDIEAFEPICQWLYSQAREVLEYDTAHGYVSSFDRITKVYAAAEKYGMTKLKNHLIGLLFTYQRHFPGAPPPDIENVRYVYSTTPTKSPMRRFLVAWYTWSLNETMWELDTSLEILSIVPEFAGDLAYSAVKRLNCSGEKNPFEMCEWERRLIYYEDVSGNQERSDDEDNMTIDSKAASHSDVQA